MKLAYVVAEYPSVTETFIAREIEAVYDAGVDVAICALKPFGGTPGKCPRTRTLDWVFYIPQLLSFRFLRVHAGSFFFNPFAYTVLFFHIIFQHQGYGFLDFGRKFLFFHRTISLVQFIRHENITHLHAQFAHLTAEISREAAQIEKIPFSVGTHAWDIFAQPSDKILAYLDGAEFISCCHRKGIKRLQRMLPEDQQEKLVLVRHGLPGARLEKSSKGHGHFLLSVGRLVPKKGLCHLIEACDLMRSAGVDVECLIVGDGPLRNPLQNMISILGLDHVVKLAGELPNPAVHELMIHETAVFCLPSIIDDSGDHDGLPNVVLEAMCAGLPVVTTSVTSAGEAIENGKNGVLVPQKDPEALAHHIGQLLVNPGLRHRLGRAARQTVLDHFSTDACIEPLLKKLVPAKEPEAEIEDELVLETEPAG